MATISMKLHLVRLLAVFVLLILSSCATRRDFDPKCGSESSLLGAHLVPDRILGANFTPACSAHDDCYDTLGKTKEECDAQFKKDLIIAAKQTGPLARIPARLSAGIYHLAVKLGGKNSYALAQEDAAKRSNSDSPYRDSESDSESQ
ncbi:MAG: hypothetical protein AAF585_06920 [Verrucomicrobiota bacterium]